MYTLSYYFYVPLKFTLLCPLGNFHAFFSLLNFFIADFFEKFFQEYHLSVKQIGSRSGLTKMLDLIWFQSVSKDYEQTTLVGNKLTRIILDYLCSSYIYTQFVFNILAGFPVLFKRRGKQWVLVSWLIKSQLNLIYGVFKTDYIHD